MPNTTYHPRGELVHGFKCCEHPLYVTWALMKNRCYNKNAKSYKYYGARGIAVCKKWHHFRHFVRDMGLKPNPKLTLERIDNNKGYFKKNCKWDTRTAQCLNRRKFTTNSSGAVGIIKANDRYVVRFDYERCRYKIGRFWTLEDAEKARSIFVKAFMKDKQTALSLLSKETVWCTSVTKIRGVSLHKDGGYVSRCTCKGTRFYLGYFKSRKEAENARIRFLKKRTCYARKRA